MPKRKSSHKFYTILKIIITILVFWLSDFIMHFIGVGERNYYYLSKFGNAILFSVIFFFIFNYKEHWKKLVYSIVFGTWISFYYLVSSYSGLVQFLGISARYAPPPFVVGELMLPAFLWWIFHIVGFYVGLELAGLIKQEEK